MDASALRAPAPLSGALERITMESECALCGKSGELRNSHVIPEFLYSEMYDGKHRFRVISTLTDDPPKLHQKGLRESLLCGVCESNISGPERYLSLVMTGQIPVGNSQSGNLVEITGLDYTKFRLFGLSVLWRAHISKLPFFAAIDLGHHAAEIKRMVLDSDPGHPGRYGFFLAPLTVNREPATDVILEPTKSRLGDNRCYRFVFGGIVWVFVVASHRAPWPFEQAFINREGTMRMLVSELSETTFVLEAMQRALKKGL